MRSHLQFVAAVVAGLLVSCGEHRDRESVTGVRYGDCFVTYGWDESLDGASGKVSWVVCFSAVPDGFSYHAAQKTVEAHYDDSNPWVGIDSGGAVSVARNGEKAPVPLGVSDLDEFVARLEQSRRSSQSKTFESPEAFLQGVNNQAEVATEQPATTPRVGD